MLPPEERLQGAQLHRYVRDELYWVLHAPRQTGKTTFLQSWMRELNASGDVVACYVSVEGCQRTADPDEAMQIVYSGICDAARGLGFPAPVPELLFPQTVFADALGQFARLAAPKPLVMLFDETDVLEGDALIRFLRLLRARFAARGVGRFPVSVALVGMRDLKDYITQVKDGVAPNPGSPFNIKQDSAVIGNFTKANVAALFAQRTAETGQGIAPEALEYVWEQSRGQPWIVNSLFMRATMRVLDEDDFSTVGVEHVQTARRQMVEARETHLDSLSARLEDPRVRRVVELLMSGGTDLGLVRSEGFRLCADLGLVAIEDGVPKVANPLYAEELARYFTESIQYAMPTRDAFKWRAADGTLDMAGLLQAFQTFWCRHSEVWETQLADYAEIFPHLLLMAFLQRITNGGGRIEREYAAGRGRMDLYVEYGDTRNIIEIKILHDYDSPGTVKEEGVGQVLAYRSRMGKDIPCYLVIFDRRSAGKREPWEARLTWTRDGDVTVVGC
jgi:hypothetical protein